MATVYGVNATKNNSPNHQNIIDSPQYGGRVRWMHDSYEAAAVAKGSSIVMGQKVPKGAYILPISKVYHDALGANSAIAIGTSELGADLSASEDTTAAGTVEIGNDVDSFGAALSSDSNIWVTASGTGALTGTLRLDLYYSFR